MSQSSESESREPPVEGEQMTERDRQLETLSRDFPSYTHDGNFCVYFKLVHNRQEAEEGIKEATFFPDFVHQFFLSSERIFGYKKPILKLFYSASRLKRYVKFEYEDKLTKERDSIEPDNVMEMISPILQDLEFTEDINKFIQEVESEEEKNFRPLGELLHEFQSPYKMPELLSRAQRELMEMLGEGMTNGKSNGTPHSNGGTGDINSNRPSTSTIESTGSEQPICKKRYQIFHANLETPGFKSFQARMQTLIMWFIDAATMIDFEDARWDFFLVFEKYNKSTGEDLSAPSVSTEDQYYFAGYATVYRYYAYPDRTRPRVSQMLLLPPYRRNGLGTTLLQSIYDYYKKQPATLDITVEDPDEECIAMRDLLDCRNCQELPSFQSDKLTKWTSEMAKEAQEKLKLCQRQARKVYEILKLKNLDRSNEAEVERYRLEIKNRLNIPRQKLMLDCEKILKRGGELPEELRAQKENHRLAIASLDENYQELVKQYEHTIKKLNRPQTC